MKKNTRSIPFTYERTLKVRLPKFVLSKNIPYLDPLKLSKGSHTIELGKFDGACDCAVTGKVKNGVITGISHARCKDARPVPPKVAEKMKSAHKKLTKDAPQKWENIPIQDLGDNKVLARMTDIITSGGCFMVCWDEGQGEVCVICCFEPKSHWCIGPSEPAVFRA